MARTEPSQRDSLFDAAGEEAAAASAPLAVRMRPRTLAEVIGQRHLTGEGTPFRKLADHDAAMSLLLWGPPGTGKTTLAQVVSHVTRRRFTELSAVTAGVRDVRAAIDAARRDLGLTGTGTILFVDEVHRFNKAQQDALLPAVENRWVSFIGATTENPFFLVVGPLLSRSLLLTLEPLSDADILAVIERAVADERGWWPDHARRRGHRPAGPASLRGRPPGADLPGGGRARGSGRRRGGRHRGGAGGGTGPRSAMTGAATSTTT